MTDFLNLEYQQFKYSLAHPAYMLAHLFLQIKVASALRSLKLYYYIIYVSINELLCIWRCDVHAG